MGHSFRVLAVDSSYSAGRPDLRLLSGDAFSVYNEPNTQIISFVMSYKNNKTMRCIRKKCLNHPEFSEIEFVLLTIDHDAILENNNMSLYMSN